MTDPRPTPKGYIGRARRCGCDCRDGDEFARDPYLDNPSCYQGCGGSKPPCAYFVHFECNIYCNGLLTGKEPVILRSNCEFAADDDLGKYVGRADGKLDFTGFQDGCSWVDRLGGAITAEWTLDLKDGPSLTHLIGYRYKAIAAWDCFGPNTMKLVDEPYLKIISDPAGPVLISVNPVTCPALPTLICVTPPITRKNFRSTCCPNCFQIYLPEVDALLIPEQVVSLLPEGNFGIGTSERGFSCVFLAGYVNHTTVNGIGPGRLPIQLGYANDTNGNPTQAQVDIEVMYQGGATGISTYLCRQFSCDGGDFVQIAGDFTMPPTLTVTAQDCVSSENDDQGPCNDSSAIRPGYGNEDERCECCDPFCQCAPGVISIYCTTFGWQEVCSGPSLFCTGGPSGKQTHSGPTRQLCCDIYDSTTIPPEHKHQVCAAFYCSQGTWVADWYLDGTFVDTAPLSTLCCPMRGFGLMPDLGIGCTGCISINSGGGCGPPPPSVCCNDSDEPGTCHITITSTCAVLNGLTCTMTRLGSHTWSGPTGLAAWTRAALNCGVDGPGVWALTLSSGSCNAITIHSLNSVCTPFISGTFGPGTITNTCGTCVNGDTWSAVLSL